MNKQHAGSVPASATSAMNKPTDPRRRTGGRSARVQAAVFEAAISLLQEKGYEALNFASIAERAGVHETSLYRRWGTKEQLVIDAVSSRVAKDIPVPDTGNFRSDLIELLQSLQAFLQSSTGQAIVQTAIVSTHVPALCTFHNDYWHNRRTLLQPLFDRAITRGELSPQADPQLLLETLIGAFYVRLFVLNEQVDETLPERIASLVLSGVGIGKPTE